RHLVRIEQTEQPAEAVVARRPMAKINDLGEFVRVGGSKIGDIDTRLRPAQSRRQRDEQHCRKIVPRIEVTRVAHLVENRNRCIHRGSPQSGKPPSESTFTSYAIVFTHVRFPCPGRGGRRSKPCPHACSSPMHSPTPRCRFS